MVGKAGYTLDLQDERLWCGDQPVPITNKAFRILRFLVSHPNRLLTKEDILDAVWGEVCVSEGLIREYVHDLRAALGDDPAQPEIIETVRGRGYRFLGGVDVCGRTEDGAARTAPAEHAPSLAVPFANLCGDSAQEYFADGITEDIITGLAKNP